MGVKLKNRNLFLTSVVRYIVEDVFILSSVFVAKPQVLFSAIVANLYTGVIVGVHVKASIQNV
jgi:hypothetical protein